MEEAELRRLWIYLPSGAWRRWTGMGKNGPGHQVRAVAMTRMRDMVA